MDQVLQVASQPAPDQEMSKLLIGAAGVVLGAMIAGVFNLIAAILNRKSANDVPRRNQEQAVALAQENRETQRVLARDAARRQRRERWTGPFLTVAARRVRIYSELLEALAREDGTELDAILNRIPKDDYLLSNAEWTAVLGFPLRGPVAEFIMADLSFRNVVSDRYHKPESTPQKAVDDLHMGALGALAALFRYADAYVDDLEENPETGEFSWLAWVSQASREMVPPTPPPPS
jgi:hypothetical protein